MMPEALGKTSHCLCDLWNVLLSTLLLSPSLPKCILKSKDFWLDFLLGSSSESVLVFLSSSDKDGAGQGGGGQGKHVLEMKGKLRSLIQRLWLHHFLLCRCCIHPTLPTANHSGTTWQCSRYTGLFPHHTTNTAPLSGEPKRNFWASTSPPFVWRIKRTQFHFQQKLKRKIMKRANLLFFSLCCIQGRGNSERHWYWVPRDPIRVTPQLSNEHVFLHL